jgi:hypothetical protein
MHPARFETVRRAQADRWVHDVAGAAIASDIGVHCYLRFVRGASPLFLHDKFSRALQIFIVLYNEPSTIISQANFWRERSRTMVKSHRRIGQARYWTVASGANTAA